MAAACTASSRSSRCGRAGSTPACANSASTRASSGYCRWTRAASAYWPASPHKRGANGASLATMGVPEMATILVVDDEQPVVDLLTDMLEDDGHTVIPAFNGRAALEIVAHHPLDLVISDVMMPFVDGIQL